MRKKAYPYPEIVTGEGGWTVTGTPNDSPAACVDNLNKHMQVPLDRECTECGINHSRMIRRHELGHVKWSPKTMGKLKPGVRPEAVEVLEEIRVNYLLGQAKLFIEDPTQCIDTIKMRTFEAVYNDSIAKLLLWVMASMWKVPDDDNKYGLREWGVEYQTICDVIDIALADNKLTDLRKAELNFVIKTANQYYNSITNHRYGQQPSYRKVQNYAAKLSHVLDMFLGKPKPEEIRKSAEQIKADEEAELESNKESEPQPINNVKDLEKRMRKDMLGRMNYSTGSGVGYWGEMETHKPPLTVNLQGRLKSGRNYRPADYGYNPKFIHRWASDKQIFKQKQNVLGGTILIDASGSMSFSGQDILEIMSLLPAVTIAMYNGYSNSGDLRIIGRNGMRVTEEYINDWSGGGNVVDGPALKWLATMPERRIWVSDMYIFGATGDTSGFNLMKDVMDTCIKGKIINLKDIQEVKEHAIKLNVL